MCAGKVNVISRSKLLNIKVILRSKLLKRYFSLMYYADGVHSTEVFLVLPVTALTSASPRLLSSNRKDLDCLLGFEYPSYFTSSPGLVSFSNPVCLTFLVCLLSSFTAKSVGEGLKVLSVLCWVFLGGVLRLSGDGPSGSSLT